MYNIVTDRSLTESGEQRKKEHKTVSTVNKTLFSNLNAENWKASGKKFLTLFVVFALLFATVPAHLVAADGSSSSEIETGTGSISGFLWVDGNGMLPTDWNGFYDTGEQPLAGYPVYLYAANDLTVHIAQTQTDWDGTYIFENLEPGNYVAGLASSFIENAEYLLPMSVTGENKFAIDWRSNPIMAFTGTLIVTENGSVENINGGMRLPMGFVPAGLTTASGGEIIPLLFSQLNNPNIIVNDNGMMANNSSFTLKPNKVYRFEIWGAEGGFANGGLGGYSSGWYSTIGNALDVTAYYYTGGAGSSTNDGIGGAGGSNGGGTGGTASTGRGGGGGGGATDIRIGGTTLSNRVIVAGGGGGGAPLDSSFAGNGGGVVGGLSLSGNASFGWPGNPGTDIAGGVGGVEGTLSGSGPGGNGVSGQGGNGGTGGGGGGGGGYFGGGGGGGRGGHGGGGSGYIGGVDSLAGGAGAAASTTMAAKTGNGMVRITEYDPYGVAGTVKDTSGTALGGVTIAYTLNSTPGTVTTDTNGKYFIPGTGTGNIIEITGVTLTHYTLNTATTPLPAPFNIGTPNLFYPGVDFTMTPPPVWMDIDLANSDGSLTNTAWSSYYQYSGGVLTIRQDAPVTHTGPVAYRIWQSGTHSVTGIVVNTGVTTSIIIDKITMTGNFDLKGNANVDLLLAGDNTIRGSVFVPDGGGTNVATIRIDSATEPGSSIGSLTVIATDFAYSAIGGGGYGSSYPYSSYPSGGNININGGTVTATARTGGYAAGIGGAFPIGRGGNITITGGTVTATSSQGAGIGGGSFGSIGGSGGTITITGGTVTAISASALGGAGIGGGQGDRGGSGGTITITGGTVKATSTDGAGIGGGFGRDSGGSGGTITITGSTVTATSSQGAGIGGGYSVTPSSGGSGGTITIADNAVVTATSSRAGAGIGAGGSGGISVPSPLSGADLTIDSTATVKAYSRFSTWPAIHAATVSGDGFFVNNYINANATYNRDIKV